MRILVAVFAAALFWCSAGIVTAGGPGASGLKVEIDLRIADWEKKGFAAPAGPAGGKTVTIQVGDQTIRITVEVVGQGSTGGGGGVTPLPAQLKAAYDSDTDANKAALKKALANIHRSLATGIKDQTLTIGVEKISTADGVSQALNAQERNQMPPNALPKTRAAIRAFLNTSLGSIPTTTALTPEQREQFSAAFGQVADALNAIP